MEKQYCPYCGAEIKRIGTMYPEDSKTGSSSALSYTQKIYYCPNCGTIAWDCEYGYKKNFVVG